jgi:SAM-dependent methyltransferase
MDKLKKLIILLSDIRLIRTLLSYRFNGYFYESGWFDAHKNKSSVDTQGKPIPWCTYSFNDFIDGRLENSFDILEFGSGNGTLYYAKKANKVKAIENNKDWFGKVKKSMPDNVELIYKECVPNGEYSKICSLSNDKFDLIIVDGRDRVNCVKNSYKFLKDDGVLILDDSEREKYSEAFELLISEGFKNIGFTGISPGNFYNKMTTIFYRDNNCISL